MKDEKSLFRLTRRKWLELTGKGVFLVGLGGAAYLFDSHVEFIRPPGALAGRSFLSHCIKCQKCLEVCPTGAIRQVLLTEDWVAAGTPRLDFLDGYCNLCLRCTDVCLTGALQPAAKETVRLGIAQIDTQRCIAWSWNGCTKCSQMCPEGAIHLDRDKRPVVDADKCNGCGVCENVCPAASIRSYGGGGKGIVVHPLHVT